MGRKVETRQSMFNTLPTFGNTELMRFNPYSPSLILNACNYGHTDRYGLHVKEKDDEVKVYMPYSSTKARSSPSPMVLYFSFSITISSGKQEKRQHGTHRGHVVYRPVLGQQPSN